MFIGSCIILIVEKRETNLMSLALLFHYLMLYMFRILILPPLEIANYLLSYFMGCIDLVRCVGVTLWFGCGGVVSVCRLRH